MPFKPKLGKRRSQGGSSRGPRGRVTLSKVKMIAKSAAKSVLETKYHDTYRHQYSVGGVGSALVDALTAVPQGDADFSRDGDKINIMSATLRYFLDGATASDSTWMYRVILLQWNELSSSSTPITTNILQNVATDREAILSPYVHDFGPRFSVLYDKVHTVGPVLQTTGTYQYNVNPKLVTKRIVPRRKRIEFTGGTTNNMHGLYLVCFTCQLSGSTTTQPYLNYNVRVNYKDG